MKLMVYLLLVIGTEIVKTGAGDSNVYCIYTLTLLSRLDTA
jgi:hypothetical protein